MTLWILKANFEETRVWNSMPQINTKLKQILVKTLMQFELRFETIGRQMERNH